MTSEVEFILALTLLLIATLAVAAVVTYKFRKRALERRIKNHFKSKTQPGRPTQS